MFQGKKYMILLKYPSRERPLKFKDNLDLYIKMSVGNLLIVVSMDKEDSSMNNSDIKNYLESKTNDRVKLLYFYGESDGKINAINRDIPLSEKWDILVATADDMVPIEHGWDKIIEDDMGDNLFRSVNYNVDPRLGDYEGMITLPIIGRPLYEKMGYIYHPAYKSEFADAEQTAVFTNMGVLIHINRGIIKHEWFKNQDALMSRNVRIGKDDIEIYLKRKENGFND